MTFIATYRWQLGPQTAARSAYAEGILTQLSEGRYALTVWLVRDEMAPIVAGRSIDQDDRVGVRVWVGTSYDDKRVRTLAFLAPVEGHRLATELIQCEVRDHPAAVERFGDEWLSSLFTARAA